MTSPSDCDQMLTEVKEIIRIYQGDSKTIKYSERELRDILSDINFILQNNRCSNCQKIVTCGDYSNFECGHCGVNLSETFQVETNPKVFNPQ